MPNRFRRELGLIIAWLVFPLVPVVLEDLYSSVVSISNSSAHPASILRLGLVHVAHHAGPAAGIRIPGRRDRERA